MEQALSRAEALKAMTVWAAKANFEEGEKGSLEAGKQADFTVLDVDLLEDSQDRIWEAKVLGTVVQGRVQYLL